MYLKTFAQAKICVEETDTILATWQNLLSKEH